MLHWYESFVVKHVHLLLVNKTIFPNATLNALLWCFFPSGFTLTILYCHRSLTVLMTKTFTVAIKKDHVLITFDCKFK